MNYQIGKALGLNSDQEASLVSSVPGSDENFFLAVLNLASDDAFTRGRQLLSDLSDNYFNSEGTPAEKLTNVFKEAEEKLADTEAFSLVLAAVSGKVLYLINKGQMAALLYRQKKISPLLSDESAGQLVSGFLESGDKVLFTTENLLPFMAADLEQTFSLVLAEWEEEMTTRLANGPLAVASLILEALEPEELIEPEKLESNAENDFQNGGPTASHKNYLEVGPLREAILNKLPRVNRRKLILPLAVLLVIAILIVVGLKLKNRHSTEKSASTPVPQASSTPLNQSAAQFTSFLDLNLVKQGFQANSFSFSVGKLLLLDTNTKTLVTIDTTKKSQQILAGKDTLGDAKFSSINNSSAFVYSSDKGVISIDLGNQRASIVAKPDKDWGEIADIAGFAGNVYLLDSAGSQLWKYLPISGGFSDKREYLTKGSKVDLIGGLKMQIDSSIYVLKQGGEILRFTSGDADSFSYGGLDKNIKDPKSFFVSSDTTNFYLLDSGNSRLLVLSKTGQFIYEYTGDKFASATDLAVDETNKKVYLLIGSQIYTMDLK